MDWNLNDTELIGIINADIDEAESYFDAEIRPKIEEHYKQYKTDEAYYAEKLKELSKKSKYISSDIADTVEGAMPSLMRIFHGTDDVISVAGKTEEDSEKADNMQDLCNFQINVQNEGYMLDYRWIKDALVTALGVIKAHWKRETERVEKRATVGIEQLQMLQMAQDTEITGVEEAGGLNAIGEYVPMYHVSYVQTKVIENEPVFENMDGAGFLYDPECTSMDDAQYVIHRKYTTVDDLRRKEKSGIYQDVEKAIAEAETDETIDTMKEIVDNGYEEYGDTNAKVNQARDRIVLYEYYGKIDINQDGLLEDVIITKVGNTLIGKQENIYEMFPFMVLSPIIEPFTLHGKSFADLIGQLQDLKTALIKEIMVNIAQSNDGREYVDPSAVNMQDLVGNKKYIRVNAKGQPLSAHVQPKAFSQMHPLTMSVIEMIEGTKENRTGITRYNQGLDANSLNKTASGINQIMNAANQKLEQIARTMAETGFKRRAKWLISANLKFIDQNTVVRLTNKYLDISPDDLAGEYDLTVNSGTGISDKQVQQQQLNEVMQIQAQLIQAGFIPQDMAYKFVYNATKKKLEEMGYKNTTDFVPSPEMIQEMMMQKQQQAMMMQGGVPNGQLVSGIPQSANAGNQPVNGGQGSAAVPVGAGRAMQANPVRPMAAAGQRLGRN